MKKSIGHTIITDLLHQQQMKPFAFQEEAWQAILLGHSGLVNAPTGCGKTFSVFLGAVIQFINEHPKDYQTQKNNGLQLLWIAPLRALSTDIARAMNEVIEALGMQWKVGVRNGDTSTNERAKQKRQIPEVLLITPESLQLLIATKEHAQTFGTLRIIAVDEWHEILGGKRGVQVELAVAHIIALQQKNKQLNISIWGISATIGNIEEAKDVLLSSLPPSTTKKIIKANLQKQIEVESIIPDEMENYPWAGHLGIKLAHKLIPIIEKSRTTLIFINTRGMTETWYQTLLTVAPQLSGAIALHHGSIERELRDWVENALHEGTLKAVVCTASLDLGVDFRPVETVVQVGSPKGVARFLQRAGRAGHSPGEVSKIYFLPTHALELAEAAALKSAIKNEMIESKPPMMLCFDVLIQYLCTLAVGDGFLPDEIFEEVKSTFSFADMTKEEWTEVLHYIVNGGKALTQYDEYQKVEIENAVYKIKNRRMAMRHRMHIGTIVSDAMLRVKFVSGGFIGVIEEYFISKLNPGDVFTLAGRNLALVRIKDMTAFVEKSNSKKSIVPSWVGGRMPLSANLGRKLRETFDEAFEMITNQKAKTKVPELLALKTLLQLQESISHVPKSNELLIEQIETKDGFHLYCYPFEGRLVHEALASILAYRIAQITPITFSFVMNDYGFELLSDQPIPVDDANVYELFTEENLNADIQRSVNSTEMVRRKFRDIAVIGGLIFQGNPGEQKKARHLQSSASLLFNVFTNYDPNNLLLRQAYTEVFDQQMEEVRLRNMMQRISKSHIVITFPKQLTPFCFPIKVDSMREMLSSEKLEDRVRKMQGQLTMNNE